MKEENKIVIDLGYDNLQLIVERNLDPGYNEVFVGLERNGVWIQDLAIVGQQYHYDNDCNVIGENGMRVLVYADAENEDYTHEFKIDVYHDPEETVTKDENDIWDCNGCDFSAPGSEFRVHETNSATDKEQELRNVLYYYPLDKGEVDDIIRATNIETATEEAMRIKHIYECTADLGEAYLQDKTLDTLIKDVVDRDELGNHLVDSMEEFLLLNSGRIVQFEI